MPDDPESNDIGYGKPPKHGQFVKGRSGNPRGRPKGAKNTATIIQDELNTRITVTENGRRKRISKRHAATKQLVNKAVAGDLKAMPMLLNEIRQHEGGAAHTSSSGVFNRLEDGLTIESIVRRIREAEPRDCDAKSITQSPEDSSGQEQS